MIYFDSDLCAEGTRLGAAGGGARTRATTKTGKAGATRREPVAGRQACIPWGERIPSLKTLERFLAEAQKAVRLRGAVSVLLTTDKAMRKLNRTYRGKDKATDVLSFPAAAGFVDAEIAGDLAISVETALRQARVQDHALACELKVLLLHGLLHLAGYDHETDEGQMARRERKLREKLRLPVGLIERVEETLAAKASTLPKTRKKAAPKTAHNKTAKKAVARTAR